MIKNLGHVANFNQAAIRPELIRKRVLKQTFVIDHFSHVKEMVFDDLAYVNVWRRPQMM
jgi:hypothetical protein